MSLSLKGVKYKSFPFVIDVHVNINIYYELSVGQYELAIYKYSKYFIIKMLETYYFE